jgi:hypothetical protein
MVTFYRFDIAPMIEGSIPADGSYNPVVLPDFKSV